jgi:hypothetical protein
MHGLARLRNTDERNGGKLLKSSDHILGPKIGRCYNPSAEICLSEVVYWEKVHFKHPA